MMMTKLVLELAQFTWLMIRTLMMMIWILMIMIRILY